MRLEATEGGTNTFIAAFSGTDCGDLTDVFCSNEQESSVWQEVTFDMDAGVTYWILIGSYWCEGQPNPELNITFNCALGACCFGETCSLETPTSCEAGGGDYFGDDTTCEPDACLYGACCTSIGSQSLTAADCAATGGDFLGNGIPCELDTCPPPNETCVTAIPVTDGTSEDCNENLIPDECNIDAGTSFDRDANGVPDECDPDCNENGVLDECERIGDLDDDDDVDFDDLNILLASYGADDGGDLDGDGDTDFDDLNLLLANYGT